MITSPKGKSYIGQTIRSISERFKEHQKESSKCVAIYGAIKKYGWENFEKEWYECPDKDLNDHEELMIEVLETLAPGGYNLKKGGDNGKLSEETKKKIGDGNRGVPKSEEHRQKLSEANLGEKHHMFGKTPSEETKQKISESQKGEKSHMYGKTGEKHPRFGETHTEETIQKISESKIGEKNPMYGKTGENNPKSKKVYQYDLQGRLIGSFRYAGEAASILEKSVSSIRKCAREVSKTAHGFKWSYSLM